MFRPIFTLLLLSVLVFSEARVQQTREKRLAFSDIMGLLGGGGGGGALSNMGGLFGGGNTGKNFGAAMTRRETAAKCYNGDEQKVYRNLCNVGTASRPKKFQSCQNRCNSLSNRGANGFLRQTTCSRVGDCECLYCSTRRNGGSSSSSSKSWGGQMIRREPGNGRCQAGSRDRLESKRYFCAQANGAKAAQMSSCQRQCLSRANRGQFGNLKESRCTAVQGDCDCTYCQRASIFG